MRTISSFLKAVHVLLSSSGTQVTESVLRSIGKLTSLRFVDLSHTSIDDSKAKHLNGRRFFLKKLSLAGTQLSVIGINDVIAGCHTFALDIGELNLDDEAVSQLKLQAFKINSRGLILGGNPITDKSLVHLNAIKELDLSDTKCTGSELEQLTQVASLKLDGITVDDAAIAKLLSVNVILNRLSLRNTQVTDKTLKALAQHNNVTELELGDGEITAEGLITIAFAPSERLALNLPLIQVQTSGRQQVYQGPNAAPPGSVSEQRVHLVMYCRDWSTFEPIPIVRLQRSQSL